MSLSTAVCKGEIAKHCLIPSNAQRLNNDFIKESSVIKSPSPNYTDVSKWKRYNKSKLHDIQCNYLKVPNGCIIRKFYHLDMEYLHAIVVSDSTDSNILFIIEEYCSYANNQV